MNHRNAVWDNKQLSRLATGLIDYRLRTTGAQIKLDLMTMCKVSFEKVIVAKDVGGKSALVAKSFVNQNSTRWGLGMDAPLYLPHS